MASLIVDQARDKYQLPNQNFKYEVCINSSNNKLMWIIHDCSEQILNQLGLFAIYFFGSKLFSIYLPGGRIQLRINAAI